MSFKYLILLALIILSVYSEQQENKDNKKEEEDGPFNYIMNIFKRYDPDNNLYFDK